MSAAAAAAASAAAVAPAAPGVGAGAPEAHLDTIQEGDHVIFDEHGEKKSVHAITRNGVAKVGKFRICVGQLIGAPWGSSYKLAVDGSRLIPVTEHEPVLGPAVDEIDKDNATLVDANQRNQGLTSGDIAAMAASGKAGEDIIAALCSNSATFEGKTEFAQEKYKRRKARKYTTTLSLRRPTSWGLCEVMFDKAPTGIWNLRPDSLSLLLSMGNVAAHSRTLLLDNCQGLLAAACAERLGGHGVLCCVGTGGKAPALSGLRQLNLAQQQRAIVCMAQLADLQQAAERLKARAEQQQVQAQANGSNCQQPSPPASAAAAAAAAATAEPEATAEPAAAGTAADQLVSAVPMVVDCEEDTAAPQAEAEASSAAAGDAVPAGVPVVAAAAAEVHEDEVLALYDNITEDGSAEQTAEQQPKKKQRRSSGRRQQQQQQQDGLAEPHQTAAAAAGPADTGKAQQQQQQDKLAEPHEAAEAAAGPAVTDKAQQQQQQPQEQQQGQQEQEAAGEGVKRGSYTASSEQLESLLSQGFNSCVIAAPRLTAASILQQVLPLLAPSSPFVVFSPWQQPLAEAMAQLTASKAALMLQLQESWMRPYQVLPGRTHPHMNMTTGGTGGYTLSGITVAPAGPEPAGGQEQGSGGGRGGRGGRRGGKRGRR